MDTTTRKVRDASRRHFIVKSARATGLMLGVALAGGPAIARKPHQPKPPVSPPPSPPSAPPPPASSATASTVNAWISIGTDETITIEVGSAEMGQGVSTSLVQIVAEELQAKWSQVKFAFAPADPTFANFATHQQLTGGSMSVRGYYDGLRAVGAAAREMLKSAAALTWGVPVSSCTAANGAVTAVFGGITHTLTYGALAVKAATLPVPANAPLLPTSAFRLIGQSLTRLDLAPKTTGAAIFGIDVRVPGMLYAGIKHCPQIGGTVASVPKTPSGAVAVVPLGNAVAVVVNDTTWHAIQAARGLKVAWSIPGSVSALTDSAILATAQSLMTGSTAAVAETVGNSAAAFAGAPLQFSETYGVPYLAHATLEPLNCTASVTATSCEIWAPTQAAGLVAATAASITGLPANKITVHTTFLGGGLGRKFEQDFIAQAIKVSKAVQQPVKLVWSREEDFTNDQYRPMALARVQAGLDAQGNVLAWQNRIVSPSILYQRGWIGPNDVDSQAVDGALQLAYAFGTREVAYVRHTSDVPVGFWRSDGHSINAFVVESAIDELALLAGVDPLLYRQRLLAGNAQALNVLNTAAQLAGWGTAPAKGHARGIAFSQGFGSTVAQVVEIAGKAGNISVVKVSCAIDCGTVINPDTVIAQMESGIVQGLGAALWGKMSFSNGTASPRNFNGYPMMRMGDMPQITTSVIASGGFIGGVGEPGVPPAAPALANAYAKLTGIRLRTLPMLTRAASGGDE
jgi:isoquinoline 1-oxidoreductase beta subunit